MYVFNAALRLSYFPIQWKHGTAVLMSKPKKPLELLSSNRPSYSRPQKRFENFYWNAFIRLSRKKVSHLIPNSASVAFHYVQNTKIYR